MRSMRLAVDAMGGDDAPRTMVQGAVDYARQFPHHDVVLVGRQADVDACLAHEGSKLANIHIEHAPEIIGMAEKIQALKEKPNDSMNRAALLVKEGKADAMVLCGNTGCSVAAAQLHLRRIPGVKRAGILTPLPTPSGSSWICDAGANSVGKPEHLAQFAELSASFLKAAYGMGNPRIGVLSNGEEDGKGTDLTHETMDLLRKTSLNLVGYVEGHDIFGGNVDIVVCDGFTGNIVLKTCEGLEGGLRRIIKEEINRAFMTKMGGLLSRPAFERVRRRVDWRHVGGCFLLGVDGACVIGHGRSNRLAVFHALGQAARCVEHKVMFAMRERFKELHAAEASAAGAASPSSVASA
jgi:glycerol-3-phosphate acyltransferase PlsX